MRLSRLAVLCLSLASTPMALGAQAPAGAPHTTFDVAALGWLAGCWEQRTATRTTHEYWMAPAGGTLHGMSRTVAGNATRAWEWLRIAPVNGQLSYVAIPSGQSETAFAATRITDTSAVFENPAHDFPQVIAYRRVSSDSIVARISATTNGRARGMDIPMRRVPCAP